MIEHEKEKYGWEYIDFINSLDDSAIGGYQLIYIDNDEIPELAAPGVAHIAPSYLCWVNNGELCQGSISFSGFAYFEKQNKYLCEEGCYYALPLVWIYAGGSIVTRHSRDNL